MGGRPQAPNRSLSGQQMATLTPGELSDASFEQLPRSSWQMLALLVALLIFQTEIRKS